MKSLRRKRRGFTLLELLITLEIIVILAAMALPNLLQSRDDANETSAIGSLKSINGAELNYRSRSGAYANLATLLSSSLIDKALGNASSSANLRSGYYFTVTSVAANTSQYYVVASPAPKTGTKVFYTDETGVIFSANSGATLPSSDASGIISSLGAGWGSIGN